MSGTARVTRGDESRFLLATLATALALGSLNACSGDVNASPSQPSQTSGAVEQTFDAELASSWEELIAHSQRISPTPNWDGSIDGMKTLWFDRGGKKGEGRFAQGRKDGTWTFWYENGQKRWEGTYRKDFVHGPERSWYANGTVCYEGTSVDGKRHGAFRAWYEDSQPWWKGEYEFGVRQGPFRYWHRDGTPDKKVSGVYVDGKRVKGLDLDGLAGVK